MNSSGSLPAWAIHGVGMCVLSVHRPFPGFRPSQPSQERQPRSISVLVRSIDKSHHALVLYLVYVEVVEGLALLHHEGVTASQRHTHQDLVGLGSELAVVDERLSFLSKLLVSKLSILQLALKISLLSLLETAGNEWSFVAFMVLSSHILVLQRE